MFDAYMEYTANKSKVCFLIEFLKVTLIIVQNAPTPSVPVGNALHLLYTLDLVLRGIEIKVTSPQAALICSTGTYAVY